MVLNQNTLQKVNEIIQRELTKRV